jgi:vacuolar-type H+-ATPase subunit I/STV1
MNYILFTLLVFLAVFSLFSLAYRFKEGAFMLSFIGLYIAFAHIVCGFLVVSGIGNPSSSLTDTNSFPTPPEGFVVIQGGLYQAAPGKLVPVVTPRREQTEEERNTEIRRLARGLLSE